MAAPSSPKTSDWLPSACTPQSPTTEQHSADGTILAYENEIKTLRQPPFWAPDMFSSIEDTYDLASWPDPVMKNAFPLRYSQSALRATVQAAPPSGPYPEHQAASAAFRAQDPGHMDALDAFDLSLFAYLPLAETPQYAAYDFPNIPMPLVSPSSSFPRPTTSAEARETEPPKRKRRRRYKSDASAVTTRPIRGRPPKSHPFETDVPSCRPASPRGHSPPLSPNSEYTATGAIDSTEDRLARNRKAATKCRAKAQATAARLETEEQEARDTNHRLCISRLELQNEVLALRHEILCHANCECPLINTYLAQCASAISHEAWDERDGIESMGPVR